MRIVVGLDEEDVRLILKQFNSHFITYGKTPGIYTIQDISDAVHTSSGHTVIIETECDDISMKTKIILKCNISGERMFGLETLRFDERLFIHTLLGFEPFWDYKPSSSNHIAIPDVYTIDKILNLSTTNKIHSKCNIIDGSVVNGLR